MHVVSLDSLEHTRSLGRALGSRALPGGVVLLYGPVGAGKTTLAGAFARALGVEGPVSSPTYVLIAEYPEARVPLRHVDLYRLGTSDEVDSLDLWGRVGHDGVWLVEWPERAAPAAWPAERLEIRLEGAGDVRRATLVAHGPRHEAWLRAVGGCA